MIRRILGPVLLAIVAATAVTWGTSSAMSTKRQPAGSEKGAFDGCFFYNQYYDNPDGTWVCYQPGGTRCMVCVY
jgi:hypothetical protein